MPSDPLESFYADYVNALHEGNAAIFAGAGLSRSAGYVDWKGLLRHIAHDLGLDIDQETDLIAVAQYHENKYQSRTQLNKAIIEEFTKDAKLTENHRLIANLPVDTVWTTNYDDLIEQAYKAAGKRVDVKISPENLSTPRPGRAVTVYKMHGDISQPHAAVLTKNDYETYDLPDNRELFSIKLKGDLVGRSFLFLGFSFTDPNIDYILSRIRALLGKNQGVHYCVMRKPAKPKRAVGRAKARFEYEATKLEHRITDLKRYGIRPLMIDDYPQVTDILAELNRRSHLRDIFISGSAADFTPLGRDRVEGLVRLLGRRLIEKGCNVVSGVGEGIGGHAIIGALEALYGAEHGDPGDRLVLRPFPQHPPAGMTLPNFWTKYRTEMLTKAGACIFVAGNKLDGTGNLIEGGGVIEEFEIAVSLGIHPIPIGATGHASRRLWEKVMNDLGTYYSGRWAKKLFTTLGDPGKTNEELVDAVVAILKNLKAF